MDRFLEHTGAKYLIVQVLVGRCVWSQRAGQSSGLIDGVKTAKQIIDETVEEFFTITERMGALDAVKSF